MKIWKAIIALVIFAGATFAAGFVIGEVISQEQYDAIDFKADDLAYKQKPAIITSEAIVKTVDHKDYEADGTGSIVVKTSGKDVKYYLKDYVYCRVNGDTKAECINNAKIAMETELQAYDEYVRRELESKKTNYSDEITPEDFDIKLPMVVE